MKTNTTLAMALVGAMVLFATPARAHHSMLVQFALDKPITLRGAVTKIIWTNPHSWIFVDVRNAEGQMETWRVETGSLVRMVKRGLKKADFQPGTEIIVGAYCARDGQLKVAGMVVTFPALEAAGREATFALGR